MAPHTFNHDRPDFAPYGFTCERWQAAPMRRPDRHNEIELNLLERGSLTYLLGGERVTLREQRLGVFWAAIPHQIIGSERRPEYYVVTIPLTWFLQCRLPLKLTDALLHGQFLSDPDTSRFALNAQLCHRWEQDLDGRPHAPPAAALLELHACLLRLADALPDAPVSRRQKRALVGQGAVGAPERMAAWIARHYQEPLAIEDVARAVQLHPNYAMNLFKQTFHLTLLEYLTRYRISHAQRLLATTDQKIIVVANEAGFASLSRFYEAFQRLCGCSPGRYRREHRILSVE
jgi:AraC family transcriptional regulator, melibiose operon regulatory protein